MKLKQYLAAFAVLALLAGCGNDEATQKTSTWPAGSNDAKGTMVVPKETPPASSVPSTVSNEVKALTPTVAPTNSDTSGK